MASPQGKGGHQRQNDFIEGLGITLTTHLFEIKY